MIQNGKGRKNPVLQTDAHCYVIEFKLGTTAVSAIRQIKANHYAEKFAGNGKTLTLVGLAFSKAKRTIVAAKVKEVAQVNNFLAADMTFMMVFATP